jgi:integrase
VEKNTWDGYQLQARHLGPLHDIPADDLTRDAVRALRTQHAKTHAPRTVNAMLHALRIAFNWAANESPPLTTNTTGTRAELLKTQKSPVVPLHPEDVRRILRRPASRRKDEAVVLVGTGVRTGELLGIRRQDWGDGWLTINQQIRRVPKSGRGEGGLTREVSDPKTKAGNRRIAPAPFAAEVLDRLAAAASRRDSLLFPTRAGGPQHGRTLNRNFHTVQERAGCEQSLGPHSARHTVAAQLIAGGANLDDVKRYLGHSSIEHTSDLYGHWIEGRAKQLGESLGLRLMPEWIPLTDRIVDGIADEADFETAETTG